MRYAWLEDLVGEGLVSKEAAENIYQDCSQVMEKTAGIDPQLIKNLLMGTTMTAMMAGTAIAAQQIQRRILDSKTKTQIDMNRQRLVTMFSPADREKAEARFNEIAKFSPTLAANEEVMRKYLPIKVRNGLTDRDIQGLIIAQMQATPNPFQYSAMAAGGQKTASPIATPEWVAILSANAMADACGAAYEKLDDELFAKTAGHILRTMDIVAAMEMEKVGNAPIPGALPDMLKAVLLRVAPTALGAGALGIGYATTKHLKDRRMASDLDQSFHKMMQMSAGDSEITKNPNKARQAFQTLAHFSPHVASEPFAAKAYVAKMVSMDQGPQPSDLRDLTTIEGNMGSVRGGMLDMLSKSLSDASGAVVKGIGDSWKETTQPYVDDVRPRVATNIKQRV